MITHDQKLSQGIGVRNIITCVALPLAYDHAVVCILPWHAKLSPQNTVSEFSRRGVMQ